LFIRKLFTYRDKVQEKVADPRIKKKVAVACIWHLEFAYLCWCICKLSLDKGADLRPA
jgi:hypothetical protein